MPAIDRSFSNLALYELTNFHSRLMRKAKEKFLIRNDEVAVNLM